MKASVIIPAYNCLQHLEITIAALEKQDLPATGFEVIVVDDGSSDGTADYLKSYSGPLDLKYVINERNLGRAISRNRGIDEARNQIALFIDADIEVGADFIRRHLEAQCAREGVYVGRVIFHPHLPKSGLMKYLEGRGAAKSTSGSDIPGRYFISGNSSAPLWALKKTGAFDEKFQHYGGEDLDLGVKLSLILPVISLPEALGCHLHSRRLDDFLEMVEGYGEHSLPRLFQLHPWLKKTLRLDHFHRKSAVGALMSAACAGWIFALVKFLAKMEILPSFGYSYLIYRSFRKGLLSAESTENMRKPG